MHRHKNWNYEAGNFINFPLIQNIFSSHTISVNKGDLLLKQSHLKSKIYWINLTSLSLCIYLQIKFIVWSWHKYMCGHLWKKISLPIRLWPLFCDMQQKSAVLSNCVMTNTTRHCYSPQAGKQKRQREEFG